MSLTMSSLPGSSSAPSAPSPPTGQFSFSPSRPAPTGGNQNNFPPGSGPELTSSASLYLYTFLATLIILILVSATIVCRSYALRRRQRALIAEAIANGTYVDPNKPPVVERPKMFEMHIGVEEAAKLEETEFSSEKEKQRETVGSDILVDWDKMAPVSCRWLNPPERPVTPIPPTPAPTPQPQRRFRWLRWFRRGRREPLLPTVAPETVQSRPSSQNERQSRSAELLRVSVSSTLKPPLTPEPPPESVRVAVLISMPFSDLRARSAGNDAEPGLPYMEFGEAEVCAEGLGEVLEAPSRARSQSQVALSGGDGEAPPASSS
ncbi:hypothetical protein L226DRAFT_143035 [Lentinus tigrinus ALCF2SS1-7]|uniref:Uncharacterized protein n=1 Tax=Lentinus tigrinus ALCF2SS1-6 TaxID=1328759 RepID=A0A5C2S3J6_9APHY|nr:hypothetical protein L227DRAFT_190668 [Lentinus tigrinus ALCF2SS1-6]RPD73008.1 hypothetical protein L226DRAFT_143035 [Lentinus tigrinus ALCF2SS1-7]